MAKIGFAYTVIGKMTEGTDTSLADVKYTDGIYMGPNAAFNFSPNANDVKDFGDDMLTETDTTVIGGTLSVEHNELTAKQEAYILGHLLDETSGAIVSSAEDIAPFLGIGFIGKSKRSGKHNFTGKFYPKVQFREPGDDNATKQENTSFSHTTMEGNMFTLQNGDWREAKEFTSLADAKAWLNGKVGIGSGSGEDTEP